MHTDEPPELLDGNSRWPFPGGALPGRGPARVVLAACCLALSWSDPAASTETLEVGQGVRSRGWRNVADWGYVERVSVTYDSVYKWDVTSHRNLGPGTLARGGRVVGVEVLSNDPLVTDSRVRPGLEYLLDGDASTAFNPDESGPDGAPRDLQIDIDLGGVFRVDRVRLFPRLDHDHRLLFPQLLEVATSESGCSSESPFEAISELTFGSYAPNVEPVVDRQFASRDVRCVRLQMEPVQPWEIAELEVYSDGTTPRGVFQSTPLPANTTYPIWGRVWYDGGAISELPVTIQTRTGPDRWPIQYFRRTGVGDDLSVVSPGLYNALPEEEQGPIRPNPDWSPWATVTHGVVRSPGLTRYLQFRITFPEPGVVIRKMGFEYAQPALAEELKAEIDPRLVAAGEEQTFTLSMIAYMLTSRVTSRNSSGFRQIEVLTTAQVSRVEQVLVDDKAEPFSVRFHQGEGFTVNLWRRITENASFIQIVFRAAVYRDGVRFEVRAVDRRVVEGQSESAYQIAQEADIDPRSPGGDLVVRLEKLDSGVAVLANLAATPRSFTPNRDGVNDVGRISYDLLRLTRPARIAVQIHDLAGRIVRHLHDGEAGDGHQVHTWDGCDDAGRNLPPGTYVYRVRILADDLQESRLGLLGLVY